MSTPEVRVASSAVDRYGVQLAEASRALSRVERRPVVQLRPLVSDEVRVRHQLYGRTGAVWAGLSRVERVVDGA